MFTGATKYSLPLVLKVGLDHVFERYAERVVCHAIQKKNNNNKKLAISYMQLKRNR